MGVGGLPCSVFVNILCVCVYVFVCVVVSYVCVFVCLCGKMYKIVLVKIGVLFL